MKPFLLFFGWSLLFGILPLKGWDGLAEEVVEALQEAVVRVEHDDALGTGFLIGENRIVLTNSHLAASQQTDFQIIFADGRKTTGHLLSYCPDGRDLMALQLEEPGQNRFLRLSEQQNHRVGSLAFSASYAYIQHPAYVTSGLISHHRPSHHTVLHTAISPPGSSGSPLVNRHGEVIGIKTGFLTTIFSDGSIESPNGLNLAIDGAAIQKFLDFLDQGGRFLIRSPHKESLRMPLPQILPGQIVQGVLDFSSDTSYVDESFLAGYHLDVSEGITYQIKLSSEDFDAYLFLYDDLSQLIEENDDANSDTTDAEIIFEAPGNGRVLVLANTFAAGETGTYTLRVDALAFGFQTTKDLTLTADDVIDEEIVLSIPFTLEDDQRISITMTSDEIDSYLIIYDQNDNLIAFNDDWNDHTFDARVTFDGKNGETYRIHATTFERTETGDFRLLIQSQESLIILAP